MMIHTLAVLVLVMVTELRAQGDNVSNGPMQILLPQTKFSGGNINGGIPIPATIAFKLANDDEWIVGVVDGSYLKMVKLKVTGPTSYDWIATKYTNRYDESCLSAFSESCFYANGVASGGESQYTVELVASNEGDRPLMTSARPLMTSARPLMTPAQPDDAESHEGCAMSYMGKCSAFLPTDKPDNLIEEVGHIESVQVCQHICKELYPDWCTWFIYDRTTNDCKVFNGTIDSFREDCQELGYQKEPSTEHCDVVYEPEEKNACYNFREDYCRYDGSLLDTLEKIETLSKCQMACQFINGCTYFQYDKQEKICKLHTDLVATRVCDMVHGTPEPDFQTCLDDGKVPWDAEHAEHEEDRSIEKSIEKSMRSIEKKIIY